MTLAAKYRPNRISDIVGQPAVSQVLSALIERWQRNELNIPSGFLFTGVRGTGKTSAARILAASLNCTSLNTFDACGACRHCNLVSRNASDSVIEIDAASNGLVADIRELSTISRKTHSGVWRVFIIDEAHAASEAAFSALLKQLEEPSTNCAYVLVTTEPHKIPVTIQSRCLHLKFNSLPVSAITDRLRLVCDYEALSYEPEALSTIANQSNGGLRDALMSLELLSIIGNITTAQAYSLNPSVLNEFALTFYSSLTTGNLDAAITSIRETFNTTRDCVQMLDAIMTQLLDSNAHHPIPLSTRIRLTEQAFEFRAACRSIPPNDPILIEALWHIFALSLGTLSEPSNLTPQTNHLPKELASIFTNPL